MLSIIHQDLFALIQERRIPITSAAISYLPDRLLSYTTYDKQACCDFFCQNKPYALALLQTQLGNILNISIPIFESDLYLNQTKTIQQIEAAILQAKELNVKNIALTGLLPSATDSGRMLFNNYTGDPLPNIMTGHDITLTAIFFTLEHCLKITRRNISQETIGFLGLGSIGTNILMTLIKYYPHSKKIILCDLYKNKQKLESFSEILRNEHGFKGEILITDSHGQVPEKFYEATLIMGASNVPSILDIHQLRPGTLIVDDSAPPSLFLSDAQNRFETEQDLLYVEAGLLKSPHVIQQTIALPPGIDIPLFRKDEESCFEIAGCILSGLVSRLETHENTFKRNYLNLQRLGFKAPRLQFHGYFHEETSHLENLVKNHQHLAFSPDNNSPHNLDQDN